MPRELDCILVLACAPSGFVIWAATAMGLDVNYVGATVGLAGNDPKLPSLLDPLRTGYLHSLFLSWIKFRHES